MNSAEQPSSAPAGNPAGLATMIETCTAALVSDPRQPIFYIRRGMARHQLGDFANAIADYTDALALNPNFAEAYNNRGAARHRLGEFAAAVADFNEAIRVRPQYAEAYNNRGTSRQAQGDLAGARADYDQAIQINPAYAEACNNRGTVRQAQSDLAGALVDFDAAIRINPRYAEAHDNRANVHALLWNHAAAVADFDAALALYGPLPPDSHLYCRLLIHRSDARYHLGDLAALVKGYRQAFAANREFSARIVVERLAMDMRANLKRLLANCLNHLRRNPDDFVAWSRRSLVWLLLGKDVDAEADAKEFNRLSPVKPSPMFEALVAQAKLYREKHGVLVPDTLPRRGLTPDGPAADE
jgi:tetratricopeptide (TPR) repeat protein